MGLMRLVHAKLLEFYMPMGGKSHFYRFCIYQRCIKVSSKTVRKDFSRLETNLSYREDRKDQFLSPFEVLNETSTHTPRGTPPPGLMALRVGPQSAQGPSGPRSRAPPRAPAGARGPNRGTRVSTWARRVEAMFTRAALSALKHGGIFCCVVLCCVFGWGTEEDVSESCQG